MDIAGRPLTAPIELHWKNVEGQVRIVPPDSDIMAVSVETAIEACRAFKQQIVFKDQFDHLVRELAEWVEARKAKVADAYLTVRDSGLLFLVVLAEKQFDREMEQWLTELELQIANESDFSLISLAVHAIPNASPATIDSFVSRRMALRYRVHAERG